MKREITRRDFLNSMLIGMGAALLELPAPSRLFAGEDTWDGYGGAGDYARSHGDTHEVVVQAHGIRNGLYDTMAGVIDTGETFDLVIIGGGLSGLGAAYHFKKAKRRRQKCLILENHPVFGGAAKRNEFIVDGHKLTGPQASNSFVVIDNPNAPGSEIFSDLGIPKRFEYQSLNPSGKKLRFDRTNFGFMLWYDNAPNIGYFFEDPSDGNRMKLLIDIWDRDLEGVPMPDKSKRDFFTWRNARKRLHEGEDIKEWLDSMTYKIYLEKVMGLGTEVARFADPVLASSMGLGCDAISAFGAYKVGMPGFQGLAGGFTRKERTAESNWHSFPGGNDGFSRYFVKALIPDALQGSNTFGDVLNQRINFEALDRPDNDVIMRLSTLAVRVEHNSASEKSEHVWVTYVKDGKVFRLKARSVVIASGGWVARRIIGDLPSVYEDAYKSFYHSPALVANVAVRNWKFLDKLGITACRWFEGFGFSCNIRQPMIVGNYRPQLDPEKPAVVTFYVPFYYPGLPAKEQGVKGRKELLLTSYSVYESRIKEQMTRLFGRAGFDPEKDIAGIILNRWGHAYVNPQPGFHFGKDGRPAPRDIIRQRFGRIAFAHSELNGHQHWLGAAMEGRRAAGQVIEAL